MLIPEGENPNHYKALSEMLGSRVNEPLIRTGLFTALAIGIHNFPEGLATFGTGLSDVKLGLRHFGNNTGNVYHGLESVDALKNGKQDYLRGIEYDPRD
jgi:hypothetical protein